MKILGNRVLVKVNNQESTIKNKMGLILPIETNNEVFLKGSIIELGSGITDTSLLEASKNNQWVCFTKEDVQKLLEHKDYILYLVPQDNIFGLVEVSNQMENVFSECNF